MKRYILYSIALLFSFTCLAGCKQEIAVKPVLTLSVHPKEATVKVGEKRQLSVTIEPSQETILTYISEHPEIASVSPGGEVTALAEGKTTITIKAKDSYVNSYITVIKKEVPSPQSSENQMPLLHFSRDIDDAIERHENTVGRTYQSPIEVGSESFKGFINLDLSIIPIAIYGLQTNNEDGDVIVAFSKEKVDDCTKTIEMLKELAFTDWKKVTFTGGIEGLYARFDNGFVQIVPSEENVLDVHSKLIFVKPHPQSGPIINAKAKDFPSYDALLKRADEIIEFENKLGLRTPDEDFWDTSIKNMLFLSKKDKMDQQETNFSLVYYMGTSDNDPEYIICTVTGITDASSFERDEIREWFENNGFGDQFQVSQERGYVKGFNHENPSISATLSIYDDIPMLEILPDTAAPSVDKERRIELANTAFSSLQISANKIQGYK